MDNVERDPVDVMFIRTKDDVAEFGPAFQRLEELVGTRGRKFFGAFNARANEYRDPSIGGPCAQGRTSHSRRRHR